MSSIKQVKLPENNYGNKNKHPSNIIFLFRFNGYYIYSNLKNDIFYFSELPIEKQSEYHWNDFTKSSTFYKNSLTLYLNKDCNLHCSYCFVDHSSKYIPFVKVKRFLDKFIELNKFSEAIIVNIRSHGEPFLHFDEIHRIIKHLKSGLKNKKFTIRIITNLTIMDENIMNFLIRNNIKVIVSFDGPEECDLRLDSKKAYERIYDRIDILNSRDLIDEIWVTLNMQHMPNFFKFFIFYANLRCKMRLNKCNNSKYSISYNEYFMFKIKLAEYSLFFKNRFFCDEKATKCGLSFCIDYEGDIFTCSNIPSIKTQISNYAKHTSNIDKFIIGKDYSVDLDSFKLKLNHMNYDSKCDSCSFKNICNPCFPSRFYVNDLCKKKWYYEELIKIFLSSCMDLFPVYDAGRNMISLPNSTIHLNSKKSKKYFNYLLFNNIYEFKEQEIKHEKLNLVEFAENDFSDPKVVKNIFGKTYSYPILFLNIFPKSIVRNHNFVRKIIPV